MMPISSNTSTSLLKGKLIVQGKSSPNRFQKIDLPLICNVFTYLDWPVERSQAALINKDFLKAFKKLSARGEKFKRKFLQIFSKEYHLDSSALIKTISFGSRYFFTRTESSYAQYFEAPLPLVSFGTKFVVITHIKLRDGICDFKKTWKALFLVKGKLVECGGLILTKEEQMTYEFQAELLVWELIKTTDEKFQKFLPAIFGSIETAEKAIFFHEVFPKSLSDVLENKWDIKEAEKIKLASSLVNQIAVLHAHYVVLRHIVPTTISVNLDKGVAYLTDFYFARGFTQNQNNEAEPFGAPFPNCVHNYLPHEFLLGRLKSTSDDEDIEANNWLNQTTNDIYQLGITLGLLFFRTFLGIDRADDLNFDGLQEKVTAWVNCDLQTKIPGKYKDSPAIPLILSMLNPDPSKRPNIMEVAENLAAIAKKHHNLNLEVVKFD